ncbi:hypothetical protein NEFER03_0066 [Nematocida sp. LUAm3]|nr:hypothetical protein NEFER03_0066 [Nematocida sp. LUAm3]KAI5173519.1 hypothetical protein NEFER02_0035 [Nematocida sp. LUAm2]KAI5176740.1 hypothetical protein NEFER01_0065 [Nematocida sp. LUAm1]
MQYSESYSTGSSEGYEEVSTNKKKYGREKNNLEEFLSSDEEDPLLDGSSRMGSFNILANCAAKELRSISKTKNSAKYKENLDQNDYSDLDQDDNIEFPLVTIQGKQLYKCTFHGCKKAFPSLSRMRRHYIIHTGVKPFKCINAECPKSFSRRDNMIQHYKGHCVYTKQSHRSMDI